MVQLRGNECRCSHCGEFFTRLRTFDRHRIGSFREGGKHRRCLTVFEMFERGWIKNRAGFWVMETMAQRRARSAGRRPHPRDLN